jgi:hypothetical protein
MMWGDAIEYGSSSPGPSVCASNFSMEYDRVSQTITSSQEVALMLAYPVHGVSGGINANGFVRWTDDGTNTRHWASNGAAASTASLRTKDRAYGVFNWYERHLHASSVNDFNGLHVVLPITIMVTDNSDTTTRYPTHRFPNMFSIHMRGLTAGSSYFIGEHEYKVFPYFAFLDADPGTAAVYSAANSGPYGIAVRVDP